MEKQSRLNVVRLPNTATLIIRQIGERAFFVSADNVIAVEISALAYIIKFLVQNGFISRKVLEGILSEVSE